MVKDKVKVKKVKCGQCQGQVMIKKAEKDMKIKYKGKHGRFQQLSLSFMMKGSLDKIYSPDTPVPQAVPGTPQLIWESSSVVGNKLVHFAASKISFSSLGSLTLVSPDGP